MKKSRPIVRIGSSTQRQPRRPHFIAEWMERRDIKSQVELVKALGVDKGQVSRWLDEEKPSSPSRDWQLKLAALFGYEDEPDLIFRHPDDDWVTRFLRGRDPDEVERIKQTLEAAFPPPQRHARN